MVEKILNNTTPYGKFRASHEGSLHSSTLTKDIGEKIHKPKIYYSCNMDNQFLTYSSV